MNRSRYTREQIAEAVKRHRAGVTVRELCREYGVCNETLMRWQRKYGERRTEEPQRLWQLEDENHRLKQVVADLTLEIRAVRAAAVNRAGTPVRAAHRRGGSRKRTGRAGTKAFVAPPHVVLPPG